MGRFIFIHLDLKPAARRSKALEASGFPENTDFNGELSYRDQAVATPGVTLMYLSLPSLLSSWRLGVEMG